MHQRKYALELISETSLSAAKPFNTPIDNTIKLTSRQYDQYVSNKADNDPLVEQERYQKLIGKLLYLRVTRHDISYQVQTSKKQTIVSKSLVEAKYRSLATTTVELTWLLGLGVFMVRFGSVIS
ncbi:hypothetical protein KY290_036677 [Solanum tuberosum]|uniref:Mitochondrial protein n=1 Tax=Solanum tuberosum TaxID=4113 RepID=A0ABQ7TUZ6_SOLTU|nr:hypothetical protein KY289_036164 [Solanum tuberosum]KAH0737972.1 hypothetical protein KY290_036677 [Solanum tuberosum]